MLEGALGIEFGRYVPNNAYIVNMNSSTAALAVLHSDIAWWDFVQIATKLNQACKSAALQTKADCGHQS